LTTRIVLPVLAISQQLKDKADDTVNAGDTLTYVITYQNTGNTGLRDAIISAEINGKILDFSKISVENGSYDSNKNVITWKASDVPELANINPKATGKVTFSIPVKSVIPIVNKLDKNFVISSVAKIDSRDIPTPVNSNKIIGSNKLELKLASKVLFDVKGYYNDQNIKNSGPIPLEVSKLTTFTIHWSLTNVSNDLTDARIVSALPSGIKWMGQVYPTNEKINYNERTNELSWDIGAVSAGTGVLEKPHEVAFQIGVTPSANQIGTGINLINKSIFTANDSFVNQGVTLEGEPKSSQLTEDAAVGYANGVVAK
jgi:hypothetical protein